MLRWEIVLASTSRYRAALLKRLGLTFSCCAPDVDEEAWKQRGLKPRELAEALARAKAESVARQLVRADPIVIGSDQVCAVDDRTLGKPGSAEGAIRQLQTLSGRSHQLITAVCVCRGGEMRMHTDITTLLMRRLSREEIERYVAADQPLDCAGAYKLEERGISLFEQIESADHSAITGLPLIALTTILRQWGVPIP